MTEEGHKAFSGECFNRCWDFIDQPTRNEEEEEDMLSLAFASLYHWKQRSDCSPTNLSVAYWQLARVLALVGDAGLARRFGEKCLDVSVDAVLSPFYVGYAYEALARAAQVGKDAPAAKKFLGQAEEELARVTDPDGRKLLAADLATLRERR